MGAAPSAPSDPEPPPSDALWRDVRRLLHEGGELGALRARAPAGPRAAPRAALLGSGVRGLELAAAAPMMHPDDMWSWAWELCAAGGAGAGAEGVSAGARAPPEGVAGAPRVAALLRLACAACCGEEQARGFAVAALGAAGRGGEAHVWLDEARARQCFRAAPGTLQALAAAARASTGVLPRAPPSPLVPALDRGDCGPAGSSEPLLREWHAWALAGALPPALARAPWRRVYASRAHGTSLSQLASRAEGGAPVLFIAAAEGGCLCGAVSAEPLTRSAGFPGGSADSVVFSLEPVLRLHRAARVGSPNFVLWTMGLESVPSGVGFGGVVGHHAFALGRGSDATAGQTLPTAAYGNASLVEGLADPRGHVAFDAVEVWEVGPPCEEWLRRMRLDQRLPSEVAKARARGHGAASGAASASVLHEDSHRETKFLMKMSGR